MKYRILSILYVSLFAIGIYACKHEEQLAQSVDTARAVEAMLQPPDAAGMRAALADANPCDGLTLRFIRNDDQSFVAVVRMLDIESKQCAGLSGAAVEIHSSRGSISPVAEYGDGVYSATITPDAMKTGEYQVIANTSAGNRRLETSKIALVFDRVDDNWGQPQVVEGLVNTLGWEDSPQITPDGEYLFTMYLPISPSCVLEKKTSNKKICRDLRGEIDSKNRPRFAAKYVGGRVEQESGKLKWDCLEVGALYTQDLLEKYDVYAPPMITYGFKRQENGSFGQPFPIAIENVSGCVGPSGLEAHPGPDGRATALMGLIDPASWNTKQEGDFPDLFTAQIQLDKPNSLAVWNSHDKQLVSEEAGLQLVFGKPMRHRQDNPHAVHNPKSGEIDLVFWDSEHDEADIFYRFLKQGGKFPAGPWSDTRKTPVFSDWGEMEIQPFFDGTALTVTRRYEVVSRDFLGKSYDDLSSREAWGPERTELGVDERLKGSEVEVLHAVGDATYATRNGKKMLYFVYMTRRSDGNLDLNIGFVEERK